MVHVHGARVQAQTEILRRARLDQLVAVAVDAAKDQAAVLVADFTGRRLSPPFTVPLNRPGAAEFVERVEAATADMDVVAVRVGVEAAGIYHRPLLAADLPVDWEVVELNPARVAQQRKRNGKRGVKTDLVDCAAMFDLIVDGVGSPVGTCSSAVEAMGTWSAQRQRRDAARRSIKNQLTSQLDRCFPGVTGCFHRTLATKAGRLIARHFTDPKRLARLGVKRLQRFAKKRDVWIKRPKAEQLVKAAKIALPARDATVARQAVAADLDLLELLEAQIATIDERLAELLPLTPYEILTTVPGWSVVRAAGYGGAVGDPARWPSSRQLYRASGLTPSVYESGDRRVDGEITREGSVPLRRALMELANGLRLHDAPTRAYAARLAARGKHSKIIWCAVARRANRIAFAMVRDQTTYDPDRWR